MCFTCACVYPCVEGMPRSNISWVQPCVKKGYSGWCTYEKAREVFSLATYMANYGACGNGIPDVRGPQTQEELKEWVRSVPFPTGRLLILCCPEDRLCSDRKCMASPHLCAECWVPICEVCESCIYADRPRLPHCALANGMMIFDAPPELYSKRVTVMGMICAIVCITSMVCFRSK